MKAGNWIAVIILFLSLAGGGKIQAQGLRYNNFHWTYGSHNSAGAGAEGTTFTSLARLEKDTAMGYVAFSVPLKVARSAMGAYVNYNTALDSRQQWADAGLSYSILLPLEKHASLRIGAQYNWHRRANKDVTPTDVFLKTADSSYATTDFSVFLKRDHLLLGLSAENALHKAGRNYQLMVGFRELATNSWLKSSPFVAISILPNKEVPEFRTNYTVTMFNALTLGASYYKNTPFKFGVNGGFRMFKAVWASAGLDYRELKALPDAVEVGLRLNFGKNRVRCNHEAFEAYDRWASE